MCLSKFISGDASFDLKSGAFNSMDGGAGIDVDVELLLRNAQASIPTDVLTHMHTRVLV